MAEPLLKVTNLTKTYNADKKPDLQVRALQDVSLEILRSEFVCMVGESGSGKSTLLHCIGSFEKPDPESTQAIVFRRDGELVSIADEPRWYRQNFVGVVFQAFHLLPNLRVWQNVEIPLKLGKCRLYEPAGRNRRTMVQAALDKLQVGSKANAKITELSGGECQRVALARAIVKGPSLLLADEPTGNLDARTAELIVDELRRLADEGVSVLMVTHNMHIAEKYADRIVELKDGRLVAECTNQPSVANRKRYSGGGTGPTAGVVPEGFEAGYSRTVLARNGVGEDSPQNLTKLLEEPLEETQRGTKQTSQATGHEAGLQTARDGEHARDSFKPYKPPSWNAEEKEGGTSQTREEVQRTTSACEWKGGSKSENIAPDDKEEVLAGSPASRQLQDKLGMWPSYSEEDGPTTKKASSDEDRCGETTSQEESTSPSSIGGWIRSWAKRVFGRSRLKGGQLRPSDAKEGQDAREDAERLSAGLAGSPLPRSQHDGQPDEVARESPCPRDTAPTASPANGEPNDSDLAEPTTGDRATGSVVVPGQPSSLFEGDLKGPPPEAIDAASSPPDEKKVREGSEAAQFPQKTPASSAPSAQPQTIAPSSAAESRDELESSDMAVTRQAPELDKGRQEVLHHRAKAIRNRMKGFRLPGCDMGAFDLGAFAIRDARESSVSLVSNIIAILFGTIVVALLLAVVFGADKYLQVSISKIPAIDGVNVWVDYSTGAEPMSQTDFDGLAKRPEVVAVVPEIKQIVTLYDGDPKDYWACIAATQPEDPEVERLTLVKGSCKVDPNGWDIILTEQVAAELNHFDPHGLVGKDITLELRRYDGLDDPETMKPSMVLRFPLRVVGIVKFSPGNRVYASVNLVRFTRDFSTNRSDYSPRPGEQLDPSRISDRTLYEGVMLHFADAAAAEHNFLVLKKDIGSRYEVNWPGEEYLWLRDVQKIAFSLFIAICVLTVTAGSISMFNTLQASVMRKIREIGILRALGLTQVEVFVIFIFQAFVIGAVAGLFGLVLAVLALPAVNQALQEIWKLDAKELGVDALLVLPTVVALTILASVVMICMIAALPPSWRASRVTPMDAIRSTGL